MAEARVRGVALHYEIVGDEGSWIALMPGSRRPHDELVPFAQMLAESGHRVLLHDRRNCGASEVALEGESEHAVWADDLRALLQHLGAVPSYVGGASSGARVAILFAIRHPEALNGLLLWRVTGGHAATEKLAQQYYGSFIEMVRRGGMEEVCRSEHFSECIAARPANREKILAMDPDDFVRVMERWRSDFLDAANLPVVGATEQQLRAITAPACIIAGNDRVHPPQAARRASALIPGSELHQDVVSARPDDDLLPEWDKAEWKSKEPEIAGIFVDFMHRVQSADRGSSPKAARG